MEDPKIKRALISVSDKTGVVELAKALEKMKVEIFSTGGTLETLRKSGVTAKSISNITRFPEILDGRVKTLHPKIHGGLLARRNLKTHRTDVKDNKIDYIDLVVVNLYPFEQTIRKEGATLADAIEQIDIGGPAMLRSAAKNYEFVTVVCDVGDYQCVIDEMTANKGRTTLKTRAALAQKVFELTSQYDQMIANYLAAQLDGESTETDGLARRYALWLTKEIDMRYGENPHQKAAFYALKTEQGEVSFGEHFEKLHGKDLSYNNVLDLTAAAGLCDEFDNELPTVVIVKHTNPCGVAQSTSLYEAYRRAYETDTQSPFGGIVAVNKPLDMKTAEAIDDIFTEIIVAPDFEEGVLEFLKKKKDRRLIRQKKSTKRGGLEVRGTSVGVLVQERDVATVKGNELRIVTQRKPTEQEMNDMLFAWRVAKHVKSNAIVYAKDLRTVGIGAGQMSRIDSARLARWKAEEAKLDLKGSAVASDAFFPFPDGLIVAAEAGATAVIQPGGSIRDEEVIKAADERGVAMVFTGTRHFKH
ncbi:MAG: bifunctional phosphoribosylaminoimidazolecarboxamide formyltransferase/IMP cyclohydrolase [Chloroherpetonaceae bacterium]|nr:bifunctional phosphoribosylaminoimidazolecarboxamide formyltransferase/IMP cyclohydrolase [Chloroherpetonaceae bacterium]MDW8438115.1 bifunctional phosphoribosylaminoimidazolecarboxamide formyltransferase/IMP cyclohydrolase [Chloroherpetonaceae bacterium]